ncbi:MAG: DUF898 family protein [Bryobacter sp.]|nr:DUF898 family protein [Bryobacter sp.]
MPFCPNCGTQYVEVPPRCGCGYLFGSSVNPVSEFGAPVDSPRFVPPTEAPPRVEGRFAFDGKGMDLLLLYVQNFILTLLTLGIYSFWGTTEVRKFYWRHMSFAGQRFEYHGTGKELFVGFLKYLGLLLVWALLVGFLIAMTGEKGDSPYMLLIYLPWVILLPFGIHGAFRYRASRTSWQGRRFIYRGDLMELVKVFWIGALLTIVTLTFYLPFFIISLRKFFFENLTYGGHKFTFAGEGKDLVPDYLKTVLLFLPTLTLVRFWWEAKQNNYSWDRTTFAGAPFRSTIEGKQLLIYGLLKVVGGLMTLGILVPFIECEQVKYVFGNLWMPQLPAVNLSAPSPDADGADALGEVLSADVDMGDGFGL